tara:strand:+ start:2789 stop:4903 length:2115 start_codon:yes stop_codon:yes gene_type:complete
LNRNLAKDLNIRKTTESKLNDLGIYSPLELVNYHPYKYADYSDLKKIYQCNKDDNVTILGKVINVKKVNFSKRMSSCSATITDDTGFLDVIWYGQPYLASKYKKGKVILVSGKITKYKNKIQLTNPETELVENQKVDNLLDEKILPFYSLKDIIPQSTFRNIVKKCLDKYKDKFNDYIPFEILQDTDLININESYRNIHFPKTIKLLDRSIKRFTFEKMLFNQIYMLTRRINREKKLSGVSIDIRKEIINDFRNYFEFELTDDQLTSLGQVLNDLSKKVPMRRMLQGEVGSGKTLVALISLFAVINSGLQGAMMAPTEILAEQHYLNVIKNFKGEPFLDYDKSISKIQLPGLLKKQIVVGLLIGSQAPNHKKLVYKLIENREIDLIIGTHTLFQENFKPYNLSYVVVDEQHRFGVNQRDELLKKTNIPHILSMSATPIPRSLALTIYGDLDISSIKQVPSIRKPIDTKWCRNEDDKLDAYKKVIDEIRKGNQAFIVCPLIHKSEKINAVSIEEIKDEIKNSYLSEIKYDFLHGEMDINEKSRVMENFKNKFFDLLIATPVIEVGVDIPNATCIIIESSDRFGMAQLHQIRGRVGRSDKKSYCYLFTRNLSEESVERLDLFRKTKDGFDLAEADLKLRGPGDYIGSRQSGISDISYKMISDETTLKISRKWARNIVLSKIKLGSKYNGLREEYKKRFRDISSGIS